MQCTKEKYSIYFYYQTCGSLIDLSKIKQNTYSREEESIQMKHRRILWGKPQLKTPLSVLSYKWNISGLHKALAHKLSSSQYNPSMLLIDWIDTTYAFFQSSKPPIALCSFYWGPMLPPVWIPTSHTHQNSENKCAILKEWIPSACKRFSHRKILATDSTLSLPLISTGSLFELACMNYLWENIQLSGVH